MSALADALQEIERTFGKGTAFRMGEADFPAVKTIPSGSILLDQALGGGYPEGRIVEVYGPESSGKTTLLLHLIANAQALDKQVAFIDAEHALDPSYASAVGVDVDQLLFSQPDYGEQALEVARAFIRSGEVGVVCIDSVAALTPQAELRGEIGDTTVGLQARMMSQAMRLLSADANRTRTLLVFTNQIREKIGVMFGSPETTPGGRALRFYASQRLDVRRTGSEGKKGEESGNQTKVTVKKNKIAPPFRIAEFDIDFGRGISVEGELIDLGLEHGIVTKRGSWFDFGEVVLGNGRAAAKDFLHEQATDVAAQITRAVRVAEGLPV